MRLRVCSVLLLLTIVNSTMACSRLDQPSPSPPPGITSTWTKAPPATQASISATATPTTVPTAESSPTPEPAAAVTPHPLTLEPGEPSSTLEGLLDPGETVRYQVHVREGEGLEITLEAPHRIAVTFQDEDGDVLLQSTGQQISWRGDGWTASSGLIEIRATLESTPYTLTVSLLPAPGGPSIEILMPNGGEVWSEGSTHTIVWRSSGVETVDIEVASGGKPLGHVAFGVDAESNELAWDLPVGLVSDFGVVESDGMRLRISSSEDPSVADQNDAPFTIQCPRIEFEPGATSTTITGTLTAGGTYRYALEASAEQTVELEASPSGLKVEVQGISDGSTWRIPAGERRLTIPSLPTSQDYFITLTSTPSEEDQTVEYTLDISIQ